MSAVTSANFTDDNSDRTLIQGQLSLLGELAELGLDVARAVAARAREEGADVERVAMAYARVSRAVRLTILLQSKVLEARRDRQERAERAMALAARAQAGFDPGSAHKARVERIIERIAKAEHGDDEDEIDRLVTEAVERLDDEDIYGDVTQRPIGELVALICRDLGLDPDWSRLRQEAWAREEMADGVKLWPGTGPP